MEYSIKKIFIDIFGEKELIDALGSDSHNIEGRSDKLRTPLIKFKDKFLIDVFGDIGGPRTPNSINNFFHKNNPKWRGMTDHVQNALVNDEKIFRKFQNLLTKYKNKYPVEYDKIFQGRKGRFNIWDREDVLKDILKKDDRFHERKAFYYDTVNGQFLDKDLRNIIEKLSVMDDENAFEYMVFLFILISVFHDTLTSNVKLQYLYNEKYVVKVVPNFSLASTEMLKKETDQQKLLSSPTIFPKTIYGRDSLIDDVAKKLKEKHVVFLYGIGGIGKTQVAKNYAEKYRSEYDTVIYGTCNTAKEDLKKSVLKDLLLSEDVFAFEPKMSRMISQDACLENDDDYAKRKLRKIKELSNERTLIIIDNFDVMEDSLLTEFVNGRYHLLITTRYGHAYAQSYPTIKVTEIQDMSDLKKVFFGNYRCDVVEVKDIYLEKLITMINCHTYTIELLAKHMSISGQPTLEMISLLEKEGIISLAQEIRNDDNSKNVAYENLLKMFKVFDLSEDEKLILQYMCFLPLDGVKKSDFKKWANLANYSTIDELEDKSWILQNTNGIALHPIIRDVVKHVLSIETDNCLEFLNRVVTSIASALNTLKRQTITYNNRQSNLRLMEAIYNITPSHVSVYYEIVHYYAYCIMDVGNYNRAIQIFNQSLKISTNLSRRINCYEKMAQCYVLMGNGNLARDIAEKGWSEICHLDQCDISNELGKYYIGLLHRLIEANRVLGDYPNALSYGEIALNKCSYFYEIYEGDSDAWTKYHIARTYVLQENFSKAINLLKEALQLFETHNDRIAIASCNDMLAISYLQDGNYDLAIECNNASYDILLSLLGEHADVANNRKWRGDIFLRKGDVVAAKKYYTEALEIYTKLGFVYLADNARNTIQKCLKNDFIS